METQTQEPKQSPNQTTTTKTTNETKQSNTTDSLNPMSGYVQNTNPPTLYPNPDSVEFKNIRCSVCVKEEE